MEKVEGIAFYRFDGLAADAFVAIFWSNIHAERRTTVTGIEVEEVDAAYG